MLKNVNQIQNSLAKQHDPTGDLLRNLKKRYFIEKYFPWKATFLVFICYLDVF